MTERIWIYVISKELNADQLQQLHTNAIDFVSEWTAHENKLTSSCEIYKNRMLIIKVDETGFGASGCSIDKLHRFIKEQENLFNIELLNRLIVVYEENGNPIVTHASKIKDLLAAGTINENTMVYDNTISSSLQMTEWKKALKNTWLNKYLPAIS